MNGPNYTTMCFVIMPFGKKPAGRRKLFGLLPWGYRHVDFDAIYRDIFQPAIAQTPLPEGGHLVPLRTDMNPAAADIDVQMFRGIVFARMVLSDITGLNPNVFYELGVRHHSNETGTVIFRQTDTPIPFDIGHIKAIPYEYYPVANIARARETVKLVLAESLKQNLVTSPIQRAIAQAAADARGRPGRDESCRGGPPPSGPRGSDHRVREGLGDRSGRRSPVLQAWASAQV